MAEQEKDMASNASLAARESRAATEAVPSAPWEPVAEAAAQAAAAALAPKVAAIADDIYSRLLDGVQDYLCENVQFNIASRLETAEQARRQQYERAVAAERLVSDLSEALKEVLPAAEHAYHTAAFPDRDGGDWWGRIVAARAAIAKAEGQ